MKLKNTVELMNSKNYRDRFKAEYYQLKIRFERLKNFVNSIEAAELVGAEPPKHDCPTHILKQQLRAMGEYLHLLEVRAMIERIKLKEPAPSASSAQISKEKNAYEC